MLGPYLAPGGRLILCSYGSSRPYRSKAEPVGEVLRTWGYDVAGESEGVDTNGVVITRVAWTDAPHPPSNPWGRVSNPPESNGAIICRTLHAPRPEARYPYPTVRATTSSPACLSGTQ